MSLLTDVADFLEAQSLIVPGAYYLSELPNEPDDIVTLHETPGLAPGFVHGKIGAAYEYPRLQVINRSKDYQVAYDKAFDIFRVLSNIVNTTLGTTWYLRISPMGSPAQIQRDQNDRILMVTNYQVSKESIGA
jgi:hypothetical protein